MCYCCDDKFVPGHRCERSQLFMIVDSSHTNLEEDSDDSREIPSPEDIPEISFHAIAGAEHPQTLRVMGNLRNKSVTVLIDGGSTHNFIDQAVVTKFGLPVNQSKQFKVMVSNREKINCNGQCQALTLNIQGQTVTTDYYILPVIACQLVLGVQWLETLGPIEMDFKRLTVSYKKHGGTYTLQGLKQADIGVLTNKEFHGLQGVGYFFQISPTYPSNNSVSYPPEMQHLISTFSHVFKPPTRLPPQRSHDHHIPLRPNAGPVSVRPYWYPYYQKTEIKKMVQEFFQSRLIRPSHSPFSSPVLLVKKMMELGHFVWTIEL